MVHSGRQLEGEEAIGWQAASVWHSAECIAGLGRRG